jgi:two-component system sensor histidine kinase DesK
MTVVPEVTTGAPASTGAPVAPAAPPEFLGRRIGSGRAGLAFGLIWLVYLWQPLERAWEQPSLVLRVTGVAALLVFAVAWAAFFAWWRASRMAGRLPPVRTVWTALGVGGLLLALAAPAVHDLVIAGFLYLGVTAVMTLPVRQGGAAVAVLVGLAGSLPRVVAGWDNQDAVVPELLLGCFAAFGVGQVLLRNIELARAREQLVELAVAQERARLARDVHDILGHSLTVITVKTELAGRLLEALDPDPRLDRVRAEVSDVEALARAALADVRATAAGTRTVSLPGELAAARQALEAAGIVADLPLATEEVPAVSRELFAWVVREGVTNVVRHSGASRCAVRLTSTSIEVADDGRGPGPSDGSSGSGLAGLCARVTAAGGRLEAGASAEGGFLLRVTAA